MKTVVAGALGECVHVAGVMNFLRLAEAAGWRTVFLGPAVSIEVFLEAARLEEADLVGVSYRLTPETGERLPIVATDGLSVPDNALSLTQSQCLYCNIQKSQKDETP